MDVLSLEERGEGGPQGRMMGQPREELIRCKDVRAQLFNKKSYRKMRPSPQPSPRRGEGDS
jgi:hypothetical protein